MYFTPRNPLCLCFLLAALSVGPAHAADEEKLPVPSAQEQEEALKLVKDIFKDDYAKPAPDAKSALAKKLLEQVAGSADSAPTKYILLSETRVLAAAGKDAETALKAMAELNKFFAVDALSLRAKTLEELSKPGAPAETSARVANEYLQLSDDFSDANNFPDAVKASAAAETEARKSKNLALSQKAQEQTKRVRALQSEWLKVSTAINTLKDMPEDAKANEAVGQYLCFIKRDWTQGLPMLAKSANLDLKTLAAQDLAQPTEPALQMAVGDAWWDYSQKPTTSIKAPIMERAQSWYEKCRANLTGLMRAKVDKRMATAMPTDAGKASAAPQTAARIAASIQAKGPPMQLVSSTFVFNLPRGDGRGGANGFSIEAAPEWRVRGTKWDFRYERSGSANGVQIVHPWLTGHVMITILKERIHVLADGGDWSKAGHAPGQAKGATTTPEFAKVFPLQEGVSARITSVVMPNGALQIFVDEKLVANTTLKTASPLAFGEGFASKDGKPMPATLPMGHAALMVGPMDGGSNKAQEITFSPFVAPK